MCETIVFREPKTPCTGEKIFTPQIPATMFPNSLFDYLKRSASRKTLFDTFWTGLDLTGLDSDWTENKLDGEKKQLFLSKPSH